MLSLVEFYKRRRAARAVRIRGDLCHDGRFVSCSGAAPRDFGADRFNERVLPWLGGAASPRAFRRQKQRTWNGAPAKYPAKLNPPKHAEGDWAESVMASLIRAQGGVAHRTQLGGTNNRPFDLVGRMPGGKWFIADVKHGRASNGERSGRWRISYDGTSSGKKKLNALARKRGSTIQEALLAQKFSVATMVEARMKAAGIMPKSSRLHVIKIGLIHNPKTKTFDVYHAKLASQTTWKSKETQAGYMGSYRYG